MWRLINCAIGWPATIRRAPDASLYCAKGWIVDCRGLLHHSRYATFRQARPLFKNHAPIYPVAPAYGADQRRLRDSWRRGAAYPCVAPECRMGIGSALDRGLSGQRIHGHKSKRSGRGLDRAGTPMGAVAFTATPRLVASVVYPTARSAPMIEAYPGTRRRLDVHGCRLTARRRSRSRIHCGTSLSGRTSSLGR